MIRRGEVWWAALSEPEGSEPGFRRPVVVVQCNEFNESHIRTVVAVALTTNLRLAAAPGNVLCGKSDTGLPRESVINISQILTVNKTRLTHRVGKLAGLKLRAVEAGLKLVLGL